jgi:hypothetical protein
MSADPDMCWLCGNIFPLGQLCLKCSVNIDAKISSVFLGKGLVQHHPSTWNPLGLTNFTGQENVERKASAMGTIPAPRGDVGKLPKWAQDHIGYLHREINDLTRELTRVSAVHPGSNLMLDGKIGRPAITLPPDGTVQFYLGEDREDYRDLIEIHHNRNPATGRPARTSLEVTGYGGSLCMLPRSSNSISLMLQGRA